MPDLLTHILALETALQSSEVRNSEIRLRELLAPDFREFGRSGRSYTLEDIVSHLVAENEVGNTAIEDFVISRLSGTVTLATYRGIRINNGIQTFTNRSSIWRQELDGGWRMVFHQGTPST